MGRCHLHLGSNQGDRKVQIARALQMIEESIGPIESSSAFYSTEAWGNTDQPDFINLAIEVEHYLTPNQLLKLVNTIEREIGRVRKEKWGPRLIDIDIIFIDDIIIDTDKLTIPHRLMEKRNFVLYPLADIAPDFIHPILNLTVKQLLENCEDSSLIIKLESEYL
ncbi:MAG: 2-amino-4-hydroxy-6-hydroxymethyldihydropteridine diphosphokinase [Saprospiraceae bacterium]